MSELLSLRPTATEERCSAPRCQEPASHESKKVYRSNWGTMATRTDFHCRKHAEKLTKKHPEVSGADLSSEWSKVQELTARAEKAEAELAEARRRVAELEHLPKRVERELRAVEDFCVFAYSAWLWDRAAQYVNESPCRAVFDELFEPSATREPLKAARRGEYQDIALSPPGWMRNTVYALRGPSDGKG